MNKLKLILVAFASVFLLFSCSKNNREQQETIVKEKDLSSVLVPESRLSLFADISKYNLLGDNVKTKGSQETYTLESLLNIEQAKTITVKEQTFTQIPFLQNSENILASIQNESEPDITQASVVKKYYVEMQCPDGTYRYVTTLITSARYSNGYKDFDFLSRPNYTGAVLYSSLQGDIIEARTYLEGRILKAKIIAANETTPTEGVELQYINLYKTSLKTKSAEDDGWEDELDASICIGYRRGGETTGGYDDWPDENIDTDDDSTDNSDNGGGGGGGGDNNDNTSPMDNKVSVNISSNIPDVVVFLGGGEYTTGSRVSISYYQKRYTWFEFSYWTGYLEKYKSGNVSFIATEDVVSTAYFDENPPCRDMTKNVRNPLKVMRIAASNKEGNYKGGTFGKFRDGNTKVHKGLDLLADVGTPVFAMKTGVISMTVDTVDGYLEKSYGNQIRIEYTDQSDNEKVTLLYAHLNSGTPIAINPRTGELFRNGDIVYQGDLIGYTGKTGNAFNVPFSHLHLGVIKKGTEVNPADYINGEFDNISLKT